MGLHEPHAGESYLGREAVNRFRVAGLDAQRDGDDTEDREQYERDAALHLRTD